MKSLYYGASALAFLISGCSGGGGNAMPASISGTPPPPPPPPPPAPDFSALEAEIDASVVSDMAIMVGDKTGLLFAYEKGSFTTDQDVAIASASKMIFGLLIWDMVEAGTLSRSDRPQDYISFWTDMSGDARSEITLDQLMGFISGFNEPPSNPGCIGDGDVTLNACVQNVYDGGLDEMPGFTYYYGPEHMQVAGLMASDASGLSVGQLLDQHLSVPLGLSGTRYPDSRGDNPRFSGNMRSNADDIALILTAVLSGDLVTDREGYLEDRTASVTFVNRPEGLNELDWHYGFGFWKECDDLQYTAACDIDPNP